MSWRRISRVRHEQAGYTLVELVSVMVVLGVVTTALTTLFVNASNAEVDANRRFQAQLTARLAMDKIRREVHCANAATPSGQSSAVTITLPSYCRTGSGSITWCTRSVSAQRYALYRVVGTSCTGGVKWADYLTPSPTAPVCSGALCVFSFTGQSTTSLAKLSVDFPVNLKPAKSVVAYELRDDIVLRNTTRS